jgi:hypothetical protein
METGNVDYSLHGAMNGEGLDIGWSPTTLEVERDFNQEPVVIYQRTEVKVTTGAEWGDTLGK